MNSFKHEMQQIGERGVETTPRRVTRQLLIALKSAALLALLAPPAAALLFTIFIIALNYLAQSPEKMGPGAVPGMFLLFTGGAYLVGGIPAMVGGLVIPVIRPRVSRPVTAMAASAVVLMVYSFTFGAHLLQIDPHLSTFFPYAFATVGGSMMPAYFLSRR